jgi:hypothetical protein
MPKTLPEHLLIRNFTQDDIPSLADLLTAAPDDGTLYQFPQVLQYPENMNQLYIKWLRSGSRDRTGLTRVAVLPQENGCRSKVVGFSSWNQRVRNPKELENTRCKEWRQSTWGEGMFDLLSCFIFYRWSWWCGNGLPSFGFAIYFLNQS